MKNLLKKICFTSLLVTSTSIFSMQGLSVITITTDDPEGYVEWLTKNSSVFQEAAGDAVSSSGICSPSHSVSEKLLDAPTKSTIVK